MIDERSYVPLYGEPVFIGGRRQLDAFREAITSPRHRKHVLYLMSEGGLGKTKLLERFAIEAQEYAHGQGIKLFCTTEIVDFYWTRNQHPQGILQSIAQQLSPEVFAPFLANTQKRLQAEHAAARTPIEDEKSVQSFLKCYDQLAASSVVLLLFDTLEICEPWMDRFWAEVFPQLSSNTVAVLAGRPYRDAEEELTGRSRFREILKILSPEQPQEITLDYFDNALIAEYFEKEGIEASPSAIEELRQMSGGKPITVALTCDWIKINGKDLSELLANKNQAEFQAHLVKRICDLAFGQDQAILAMAHFHRRFDESLMAFVFKQDLQWVRQVLAEVSRYSFVKYRKPVQGGLGSALLHDEMRRLVDKFAWPIVDPTGQQRQYWSERVLPYYDTMIQQSENPSERFVLQLEKLHYVLDCNPTNCHDYVSELCRKGARAENDVDVRMITAEIQPYAERLSPSDADLVRFYLAWANTKTTGDFSSSVEELLALDRRNTLDEYEATQLHHWLATALAADGQLGLAKQYANRVLEALQAKLSTLPDGSQEQQVVNEGIGGIYNSLGLIARREGDLGSAIQYYELALGTQISWAFRATVENNLSFSLLVSGDARRAERICRRGLDKRRQLNVPNELGLSYNVLGIILTDLWQSSEASSCFEQALACFERAGNKRGTAISLIGSGRLLRKWGVHKEHREFETIEEVRRQYYQKAIERLESACNILRAQDDEITLAEALDELGCTYRESGSWQAALDKLEAAYEIYEVAKIKPKMADTLQNMAITYQRQERWDLALEYAEKVEVLARETSSFYVFSKAKWTLGDIAFAAGDIQRALREYSQAGILLAQPSSDSTMYDSRAREMLFEDLLGHIKHQLFQLESVEDVTAASDRLIQEWSEVGLMDRNEYAESLISVQSWPEEFLYASHQ